jgi:hypothetical protein
MPTYTFKLILAGQEAAEKARDRAMYDHYVYADTDAHLQGCDGIHCLEQSREAPSLKDAVCAAVDELGRVASDMAVVRVQAGPDLYSEADRWFAMNPPRGHALAKFVRDQGRGSQSIPKNLPPLTEAKLRKWIQNWCYRTGSLPTADSGTIPGLDGATWGDIDRVLANGGRSLAEFIAQHWKDEHRTSADPSSYVRCGDTMFCLGSVQAMTFGDVYQDQWGRESTRAIYQAKLLIAGEWICLYGAEAHRVRDYLTQAWIAQRQFVHLDASPQEPPTATAESPPTKAEPAPEPGPPPSPGPEPEKRRHFL